MIDNSNPRAGFIGLGRMGKPMCRYILRAGFPLIVHDLKPEAVEAVVALGARGAGSAGEVGAHSDVILVMVIDDAGVRAVVSEILETAHAGAVIAICSSIHPDTCRGLERIAAARGVGLVDSPVARGTRGAEAGDLTIFFGGEKKYVDACRPVFSAFSEHLLHMGAIGAGQITKTCNNLLHWAGVVACHEVLTLGARLGLKPNELRPAMLAGSADSRTLRELDLIGMYWPHKDLEVALELAHASETPMPLTEHVSELVKKINADDLKALFR